MNRLHLDEIADALEGKESLIEEMASSLRFRNRQNRKSNRFFDDELPQKRKRNNPTRLTDYEYF